MELNRSNVCFNEEAHTYTLGDKTLSGVTSLLSATLFPNDFAGVDEELLAQRAKVGTNVHNECHVHDLFGVTDTIHQQLYSDLCQGHDLEHVASEYLVSDNETCASMIDCVYRGSSEGSVILADIKTTSTFNTAKVQWQLSIYKYLFELQNPHLHVERLCGIHFTDRANDDTFQSVRLVNISARDAEHVKKLLRYFVEKLPVTMDDLTDGDALAQLRDAEQLVAAALQRKKQCEEEVKELNSGLLDVMKQHGVRTWKGDKVQLIYKDATTSKRFDATAFAKAHPEFDLTPYYKESKVSESLTIKLL